MESPLLPFAQRLAAFVDDFQSLSIESPPAVLLMDGLQALLEQAEALQAETPTAVSESRELAIQLVEEFATFCFRLGNLLVDAENNQASWQERDHFWIDGHDSILKKIADAHLENFTRLFHRAQAYLTIHSTDDSQRTYDGDTLPAEYREGSKPDGEPLIATYVSDNNRWLFSVGQLANARRSTKVKSVNVKINGSRPQVAHNYKDLLALRDERNDRDDSD